MNIWEGLEQIRGEGAPESPEAFVDRLVELTGAPRGLAEEAVDIELGGDDVVGFGDDGEEGGS